MRRKGSMLAPLLGLVLAGCGGSAVSMPSSRSVAPVAGPMRGGAAAADITPPAGLALFGHGPEARMAAGHRGRLRCRALVLEQGDALALVTCDLAAVSMLLHREVGVRTAAAVGIGADRLVLSATHTHAGFAHYFGASAYNGSASTQRAGFDPDVLRWLADRIADAVVRAAERARRGAPVVARWTHAPVEGALSRNRSTCAHCRNADPMVGGASTCPSPPRPLPAGDDAPRRCLDRGADPAREVDRTLSVLRVDRTTPNGPRPIALYAVFPVHPTVVPNGNDLYHADLFGFATRRVEAALRRRAPADEPFVALLANGHEGDVSPAYERQGWPEARRLGDALGGALLDAHAGLAQGLAPLPVTVAYGEAELPEARVPGPDGGPAGRLCAQAEPGTASFGGAEDGPTNLACWPTFREGSATRRWTDDCHSPKRSLLFRIPRRLALDEHSFPTVAPMHVARVGHTLLATVPGEVTTTAGLRLRRHLRSRGDDVEDVAMVGLAGGYLQYITTAAEYSAQHYEGASTLYGPWTFGFFADRLGQLDRALRGEPLEGDWALDEAPERSLRPGVAQVRWPRPPARVPAPRLAARHFDRTSCGARFTVAWRGGHPGQLQPAGKALVRVERWDGSGAWSPVRTATGTPADDRDPEVVLHGAPLPAGSRADPLVAEPESAWLWTAAWTPACAPGAPRCELPAGVYRFRIRTAAGVTLQSAPWKLRSPVEIHCWQP
ncbi:MAG: neutral/alkaline non-lysosomal ceramidase N-terminal domain-containing protein [Myxococcota bacterium]